MKLVLISGVSGSGKSIALNVLEDAGYYCVDNLPAHLLPQLVEQLEKDGHGSAAVAIDMRGGAGIADLPAIVRRLQARPDVELGFLFLDARDDILIRRFSETRRRHPLASGDFTLGEAIAREREALQTLASLGHHIDTSNLKASALRDFVREFAAIDGRHSLTLLFESFGFKNGLPLDADLVFDVRCLPNPHYDPELRNFTGRDAPVIAYLETQPDVARMLEDIAGFVGRWLPAYINDSRSYLTVAIGCTGGQHRSVYISERLAQRFRDNLRVLVRHRALAS